MSCEHISLELRILTIQLGSNSANRQDGESRSDDNASEKETPTARLPSPWQRLLSVEIKTRCRRARYKVMERAIGAWCGTF